MNKEFPFDRFFRKHVTAGRLIVFVLCYLGFLLWGPALLGKALYVTIVFGMLYSLIGIAPILFGWQIYWFIKYRPKPEFCKECGRAKPIKYED